ncbi:two-component system activity regulator YycH [Melissococcus plutonius]|uniref:YycH protein n=1 Tax=Melissococcus plutonius TaxID=33970 RepID=A0A2Z5Y209_9ENTE|nr:two-component system activity regulator YycH [Melissococcus plutonius]BAL61898.1 YycH protein [Melissococcus plutonius DAT561]MCV2499497.1 two-component system activity regulator YycH [Melissococcus plutonius]MCV2501132.1 two-component system activity regulator YycH [Melissococcus plutonius]MCV2505764.1 two-component system activity regulator YycH [Melissococcus plutonius]MCV2508018.1 two-component system activity regulator YycH [Melissococcus plutonius]
MKKLSMFIIRIGLILLILLSVYLSAAIWLSSSQKEKETTKNEQQLLSSFNERTHTETFLPLQLVKIENKEAKIAKNVNLITHVQNEIKKGKFSKLTQIVNGNSEQFKKYLSIDQGIELCYEGPFSLTEYISIYGLNMANNAILNQKDAYFTRIQLDFNENKIRFFDFNTKQIYQATFTIDKERLMNNLNKEGILYQEAVDKSLLINNQFFIKKELKMKKYSYILGSQPVARFQTAFFNNPKEIHTNGNSKDASYVSNDESLFFNEELGTILFHGKSPIKEDGTYNIYSESFAYIKGLGTSMGNLRYFDNQQSTINYRTFIEGFPVFSKDNKGQVNMTIHDEPNENQLNTMINTSIDTIQIPIPSEEEEVLKNTYHLFDELLKAGAKKEKIGSMIVGYTWQNIEETKQVVDLTPEWYICYNKSWYSEQELIRQLPELEVK